MNKELETYARTYLKRNLRKCESDQFMRFKRMYSHKDLTKSIDETVDNMPVDRLDWAMQQIERTLIPQGVEIWNFQRTSTS